VGTTGALGGMLYPSQTGWAPMRRGPTRNIRDRLCGGPPDTDRFEAGPAAAPFSFN